MKPTTVVRPGCERGICSAQLRQGKKRNYFLGEQTISRRIVNETSTREGYPANRRAMRLPMGAFGEPGRLISGSGRQEADAVVQGAHNYTLSLNRLWMKLASTRGAI